LATRTQASSVLNDISLHHFSVSDKKLSDSLCIWKGCEYLEVGGGGGGVRGGGRGEEAVY